MPRKIAFIGGGNMASSLVGGLVESGCPPADVVVAEPEAEKRRILTERFGVSVTADNRAAAGAGDVVVLAVKPQIMAEVVTEVAAAVRERGPLVVSIAAGRLSSASAFAAARFIGHQSDWAGALLFHPD